MKQMIRGIALLAAMSMCVAGTAFAGESVQIEPREKKEEMKTLGVRDTDSSMLELTNETGTDISYISIEVYDPAYYPNGDVVRMQEALIEQGFLDDVADGSYGPKTQAAVDAFRAEKGLSAEGSADEEMLTLLYGTYDDGNFLTEDDLFKTGESRLVYIPAVSKEAKEQEETADDALTQIMQGYELTPLYLLRFAMDSEEEDTVYVVHTLILDGSMRAELHLEGDLAYLIYTKENEDPLSTQEIEQAIYDAEHPAPAAPVYNDYDDYGDYSYDPGYEDPGYYYEPYEEPVYAGDGCIDDPLFNP